MASYCVADNWWWNNLLYRNDKLAALVYAAIYSDAAAQQLYLCFDEVEPYAFAVFPLVEHLVELEHIIAMQLQVDAHTIVFYG